MKTKPPNFTTILLILLILLSLYTFLFNDQPRNQNKQNLVNRLISSNIFSSQDDDDYISPLPFKLLINEPDLCALSDVYVLNMIPISVDDFGARNRIREQWLCSTITKQTRLKGLFIIGKITKDIQNSSLLESHIQLESSAHHDIIQIDVEDNYKNLVAKTLTAFYWKNVYCTSATWLLKSDSDILVNPMQLTSVLQDTKTDFLCKINEQMKVCRNQEECPSKWIVSKEDYPKPFYPPYCDGPAYVIRDYMSKKIYSLVNKYNPLFIEDVYFTGILAQLYHASYTSLDFKYRLYSATPEEDVRKVIFILYNKKKDVYPWPMWYIILKAYKDDRSIYC